MCDKIGGELARGLADAEDRWLRVSWRQRYPVTQGPWSGRTARLVTSGIGRAHPLWARRVAAALPPVTSVVPLLSVAR